MQPLRVRLSVRPRNGGHSSFSFLSVWFSVVRGVIVDGALELTFANGWTDLVGKWCSGEEPSLLKAEASLNVVHSIQRFCMWYSSFWPVLVPAIGAWEIAFVRDWDDGKYEEKEEEEERKSGCVDRLRRRKHRRIDQLEQQQQNANRKYVLSTLDNMEEAAKAFALRHSARYNTFFPSGCVLFFCVCVCM